MNIPIWIKEQEEQVKAMIKADEAPLPPEPKGLNDIKPKKYWDIIPRKPF